MGEPQEGGIRVITVGDFMTRELVTVKPADDLALAESILRLGGIRHLPVVEDGRLAGLVTQRDLLRSAAVRSHRSTLAGDIMVRDVVTARPSTSLVEAARIMLGRKFGCLPVVEENGRLVGIITESDFVRFAADMVQDLDMVAEAVSAGTRA
jgi:CBS domain-containing membrane protein/CBS domain-containing protein